MTNRKPYHTLKEVAEIFGISERTAWKLIKKGCLEAYRIGDQYRISQDQMDAYLKKNKST